MLYSLYAIRKALYVLNQHRQQHCMKSAPSRFVIRNRDNINKPKPVYGALYIKDIQYKNGVVGDRLR